MLRAPAVCTGSLLERCGDAAATPSSAALRVSRASLQGVPVTSSRLWFAFGVSRVGEGPRASCLAVCVYMHSHLLGCDHVRMAHHGNSPPSSQSAWRARPGRNITKLFFILTPPIFESANMMRPSVRQGQAGRVVRKNREEARDEGGGHERMCHTRAERAAATASTRTANQLTRTMALCTYLFILWAGTTMSGSTALGFSRACATSGDATMRTPGESWTRCAR